MNTHDLKSRYYRLRGLQWNIIAAVMFLSVFGIIMSFSCSMDMGAMWRHAGFVVAGIICMLIMQRFPYRILGNKAKIAYIVSIIVILLLLVPGIGVSSHGATRWLKIGGITVQAAEIVKLCMIVFLADLISGHIYAMNRGKSVVLIWIYVGVIAGMVLVISSNLSSCLILLMMTFAMTFISGNQQKMHIGILLIALLVVAGIYWYFKNHLPDPSELEDMEYHLVRIVTWIAPEKYQSDESYQILQGLYAIGSGGLMGVGLGNSMQKYVLPEASNDMIVCIIVEEMGLVGITGLILLFLYLFYHIYLVAIHTEELFGRLLCAGVLFHLVFQTITNIAVAVNAIPNTGVSLPFISSGGTSILVIFCQIGIVLSVQKREVKRLRKKIAALEK